MPLSTSVPNATRAREVPKPSKRGHRKSRDACIYCKRRKVKCDKAQPTCTNCVRFGLPCTNCVRFAGERDPRDPLPLIHRRGRGRPRKDWSSSRASTHPVDPSPSLPTRSCGSTGTNIDTPLINGAQAELLHHFITCTSLTLGSSDNPEDPTMPFWARNAPRLGLSTPSILYFALSLAAYHLVHMQVGGEDIPSHYPSLAQSYQVAGLAELRKEFPNMNHTNCGSLYVATILLCLTTFAAGPTSPDDLLICDASCETSGRWLSLASGTRLINQRFDSAILFSGPTKPLSPSITLSADPRPSCECENFSRIDWEEPLNSLRTFITSQHSEHADLYLKAFDIIANVYEATYGTVDGVVASKPMYKMVMIWLYCVEDRFITQVRKQDAVALLLLAYYAPLLKTMRRAWFLSGWTDHLLTRIRALLSADYTVWLECRRRSQRTWKFCEENKQA